MAQGKQQRDCPLGADSLNMLMPQPDALNVKIRQTHHATQQTRTRLVTLVLNIQLEWNKIGSKHKSSHCLNLIQNCFRSSRSNAISFPVVLNWTELYKFKNRNQKCIQFCVLQVKSTSRSVHNYLSCNQVCTNPN